LADGVSRTWPALDLDTLPTVTRLPEDFDDTLALLLDDLSAVAVESEAGSHWRVYFDDPAHRDAASSMLARALAEHVAITSVEVPDEGWARKAQQTLRSVTVDDVIVSPPWDVPPVPSAGHRMVIVIEPSTGFGTGHHESTRLCLRLLQRMTLRGCRVIDVGTGSGVLAIAAALGGADTVLALDNDTDAVQAAKDNAARNRVLDSVEIRATDLGASSVAVADVVLANLTMAVLRRYRTELARFVGIGGTLIVSGFTHDQVALVVEAYPGFDVTRREDEDDWAALLLCKRA
jgi:ribosomal protein L11 methyltransferase